MLFYIFNLGFYYKSITISSIGIGVYVFHVIFCLVCTILLFVSIHYKKINLIYPLIILFWIRGLLPNLDLESRAKYMSIPAINILST
jgi:hypothetical protein